MAKNLRAKIPKTDTLVICDTNASTMKKFVEQAAMAASSTNMPEKGSEVQIANRPREVAQTAVSLTHFPLLLATFL